MKPGDRLILDRIDRMINMAVGGDGILERDRDNANALESLDSEPELDFGSSDSESEDEYYQQPPRQGSEKKRRIEAISDGVDRNNRTGKYCATALNASIACFDD